jgi:DNA-binding NarL/FixJ family response regulator
VGTLADIGAMTEDRDKPARPGEARASASLLIVEDEALIASYIQEVLAESGFTIVGIASSGPEALSLAGESRPDLALVDIKLAGAMDGIEAAQLMRKRYGTNVIFLSATSDPDTIARAQTASPLGFLEKPFRPSQVYNALRTAMRRLARSP